MKHLLDGDPPACVDCIYYHHFEEVGGADCHHDACSMLDTVKGRQPVRASAARGTEDKCGLHARYYEARPEPDPWLGRVAMLLVAAAVLMYCAKVGGWW